MKTSANYFIGIATMLCLNVTEVISQNFPVPGTIAGYGTQTCIPFVVSGLPPIITTPTNGPGAFINNFTVNIQTSHPWTLELTLVSPAGTVVTLSSFNGWGGVNYTNTNFSPFTGNSIVGSPAPFTGNFQPQGTPPGFNDFLGENPNGIWNFCLLDTLTNPNSVPSGGNGIGPNSSASATMGFGSACMGCPFPMSYTLWPETFSICPGEFVDISSPYSDPSLMVQCYDSFGSLAPCYVNAAGTYTVTTTDLCSGNCTGTGDVTVVELPPYNIGNDQAHYICQGQFANILQGLNLGPGVYLQGMPFGTTEVLIDMPGFYGVVGNTAGTCPDTAWVEVVVIPQIYLGNDVLITECVLGSYDLTQVFPTAGFTTQWTFNGGPVADPTAVTASGSYMVIASDPLYCSDTAIVDLIIDIAPSLGANQLVSICDNEVIDLTSFFNTTGFTDEWTYNGGIIGGPVSVNQPGIYTLISSGNAGCADTVEVDLTVLPSPLLGADQFPAVCSNVVVDLNSYFNTSGLNTVWNLFGVPFANPSATNIPGVYELIATSIDGCSDSAFLSLLHNPAPVLGPDQTVSACTGTATDLTLLFPSANLTTDWYYSGSSINIMDAASATFAGVYDLIGIDINGCSDTASVLLNLIAAPQLGPDVLMDFCSNATVNLNPIFNTAGLNPVWTYNSQPVANPSSINAQGIYSLVVTNSTGCTDTAEVTLNVLTAPALGVDQSPFSCSNVDVDLNSYFNTSGLINDWSISGLPVSNPATINIPGIYELIATNIDGCADTALLSLSHYAAPALGPDQTSSICPGTSTDLTSLFSTAGLTTDWYYNGGSINSSIAGAATLSGQYQIIAINANNCSDTASVVLNFLSQPQLGANTTVDFCSNTTVDLNPLFNTTGLTTAWTFNGQSVVNPSAVNVSGNYTLVVVNSLGCTDTAQAILNALNPPVLGADQSVDFCSNTAVNLTSFYNTTGLISNWTLNGVQVSNPSSVVAAGTYNLNVTDANGCIDQASVTLDVLPAPTLGVNQVVNLCPGETVNLNTLFVSSGLSTEWTFGGILQPSVNAVTTPGIYQLVGTNISNCSDTAIVTVNSVPSPVLGPDQIVVVCEGEEVNLTTIYNTGNNSVVWNLNNNPVSNPSSVTQQGVYVVTATSNFGCSSVANVTVNLNAVPQLGSDQTVSFCSNSNYDLTQLFSLSGLTPTWTSGGATVNNPSSITTAGSYQLIAVNSNGCSDTAVVNASINTAPELGDNTSYMLCPWMTINLNDIYSTQNLNISWTYNGQALGSPGPVRDPGNYSIYVTDVNGCADDAQVTVDTMFCECVADFVFEGKCIQEPVQFAVLADSIILNAHWSFSHPLLPDINVINPSVKFLNEEMVQVTLDVNLACGSQKIIKEVQLIDCSEICPFYFPNAFTPNKDGKNEKFGPYVECIPQNYEIEIRNRFGQVVFTSDEPGLHWDGSYQNLPSPSGIYIYSVNYKVPYQSKKQITGTVSLVR